MVIKKTQTELILREEKEKLNVLRTILTSLTTIIPNIIELIRE
jgi:hypothetical protein